ncbi:FAD-binding protein [Allokutzneria oryzae]|uniref:FAD-binding protein n=1 Tax=Allokutzneria oryzae TaxID=1378989 RepID=A0ABV6AAC5_9PSEU
MTRQLSRNSAAAYNPNTRLWESEVSDGSIPVPPLEGQLTINRSHEESSHDLGNIVVGAPAAVLHPACAEDIAVMVALCHALGVPVAARGEHHTTHGQSLAPGGLAIEMTSMARVHEITDTHIRADAGLTWRTLVHKCAPYGLRAAGLPGYLKLTLGGTLSVGGISTEHREGGFVDRVSELEIVTGTGEILCCSPTVNAELFHAALGGLGQVGIITTVTLELLPLPAATREFVLHYDEIAPAFRAMRTLMARDDVEGVFALVVPPTADVPPLYQVRAHCWGDEPLPSAEVVLADVPEYRGRLEVLDQSYVDHVSTFDRIIRGFRITSNWDATVKPWFDAFLPDETIERYLARTIPALTPEDWNPMGFVLLLPHLRESFTCPRFRVPEDTDIVWLFDILNVSVTPGPDPDFVARMMRRNNALWSKARVLGGVRYPIGSLDFSPADWAHHYGETWPDVLRCKRFSDPAGVLTPMLGIRDADQVKSL